MKCLTDKEFQALLGKQGIYLAEYRQLDFPKSDKKLRVSLPEKVTSLNFFALAITNWLLDNGDGVIYLSQWGDLNVAHQIVIFEKIRASFGEMRNIIEAPAHLFDISTEQEKSVMAGMIFLVMANDWNGYFFCKGSNSYLYTSDEFVLFASDNDSKIDVAYKIADEFGLRRRDRWVGEFTPKVFKPYVQDM